MEGKKRDVRIACIVLITKGERHRIVSGKV